MTRQPAPRSEIRRVWISATVDLLKALLFAAVCILAWYAALVFLVEVR